MASNCELSSTHEDLFLAKMNIIQHFFLNREQNTHFNICVKATETLTTPCFL